MDCSTVHKDQYTISKQYIYLIEINLFSLYVTLSADLSLTTSFLEFLS